MRNLQARAVRLSDLAYEEVKKDLISCKIAPGEVVSASKLAKELNISRSPLQSAFIRLHTENFLTASGNSEGYEATLIDAEYIRDIYTIRASLEALCAELAVDNPDHDLLKQLYEEAKEMEAGGVEGKREELEVYDEKIHNYWH